MCKGQMKVKTNIIQMYSTQSGLKVESKGRESFSFSLIQRESRELLLPLSLSSLRQNPPNNRRTISHPSPLEIYWFFGSSIQFCTVPLFILFENRFCINPHPMRTFCKTSPRPKPLNPTQPSELPLSTVEHNVPLWSRLHQSLQTGMTAVGGEGARLYLYSFINVSLSVSLCVPRCSL